MQQSEAPPDDALDAIADVAGATADTANDATNAPETAPTDAIDVTSAVDAEPEVDTATPVDAEVDVAPVCTPAVAIAAAPTQTCGAAATLPNWLAPSNDPQTWVASCGALHVELSARNAGAIRVRYLPTSGAAPWPSGALVPQTPLEKNAFAVGQTCTGAVLCTSTLAVHVDAQCRVFAVDHDGTTLLADPDDGGFSLTANGQPRLTRKALPGERFYGLGGKTGGLDRRGRKLILRTTDAYNAKLGGYDPQGDPLYQAVPWLLIKRGGTTWGVLTDDPWQQTYDLAASASDRWSVTATGGVLEQTIVAGPTPAQVLHTYAELTGQPALPPRWALGYHQSRWGYKDAATFTALAQKFRDLQLPCDSLWFDIQKMDGFRAFTWDPVAFADPQKLLTTLHNQGFHTVAIVDPGLKADSQWPPYAAGVAGQMFLPAGNPAPYLGTVWPGLAAFPDFTNPIVRDWWAQTLVPLETALGIDALWIDMNEPSDFNASGSVPDTLAVNGDGQATTMAAAHNVFALREAQATYAGLAAAYPDRLPFVLTRAGYAGIQRYAAAWTGDAPSTAETLAGTLPMLLGLGLSGEPMVGSDVGGYSGSADPALFARWFALGSISPFFRGHAEKSAPNQEPWQFGQEVQDIARELLNARYRLLPYLESLAWQAHMTAAPILRPLWWEFPNEPALETIGDEVLLGPFVLFAPHLSPTALTRTVTFPPGRWVQATSGAVVVGPATLDVTGPLADLPMWLREGAIVPRGPVRQWTTQDVPGPLDLDVVPGPQPTSFYLQQGAPDGPLPNGGPSKATLLTQTPTATGTTIDAVAAWDPAWIQVPQAWRVRVWRLDTAPTTVWLSNQKLPQVVDAKQASSALGWTWFPNDRALVIAVPASAMPQGDWQLRIDHAQTPQGPPLLDAPTVQVPITVHVPGATPAGSTVYVAHSGNGWQQQPLTWTGKPGEAAGLVTVPRGQWFEYKFTRGAWATVEKYPGCVEAKNRYAFGAVNAISLDVSGKDDTVWAWADACP